MDILADANTRGITTSTYMFHRCGFFLEFFTFMDFFVAELVKSNKNDEKTVYHKNDKRMLAILVSLVTIQIEMVMI